MLYNDLLEEVAMRLAAWPKTEAEANGARSLGFVVSGDEEDGYLIDGEDDDIDEHDYMARRRELINEPSDCMAPPGTVVKAQDASGCWFFYKQHLREPGRGDEEWGVGVPQGNYLYATRGRLPAGHDWRKTQKPVMPTTKTNRPMEDAGHVPEEHYRQTIRVPVTAADARRGYAIYNLDPYRVAQAHDMRGGPREQIMKKCLRFTAKGQTEDEVIADIRSALDRWEQMRKEDGAH